MHGADSELKMLNKVNFSQKSSKVRWKIVIDETQAYKLCFFFLLMPRRYPLKASLWSLSFCSHLCCIDIVGASLLLRLFCFNASAACLSKFTFCFLENGEERLFVGSECSHLHRAVTLYHVWPASPFCFSPSTSLHFLLLSSYKDTGLTTSSALIIILDSLWSDGQIFS